MHDRRKWRKIVQKAMQKLYPPPHLRKGMNEEGEECVRAGSMHACMRALGQRACACAHLLAVVALHVQEVGGVHAAVDALLVARDPTLDGDALGRRAVHKVLQVLRRVVHRAAGRAPARIQVLKRGATPTFTHFYSTVLRAIYYSTVLSQSVQVARIDNNLVEFRVDEKTRL